MKVKPIPEPINEFFEVLDLDNSFKWQIDMFENKPLAIFNDYNAN